MLVGLKMTHKSLEHYSTGIFSNVCSSFWHISHFRRTLILNQCASLTLRVVKSTARWTPEIGGGIHKINLLLEQWLCLSFVHPTRLTWSIFRAISMPGRCISPLVIFEKISAVHLTRTPGFLSGWSHVPWRVPKTLTRHGIPQLELCCLNWGILTSLALAWNGIVQMDSSENVTLFWLPGSRIIRNKWWLLKSHMAHARCVKFLKVRRWGISLFDHSITQETSIFTWSCSSTIILMLCTLWLSTQSATSSGNTLSAMSIGFGSLMNWISCSWGWLKTYCTGYSNTWKLEIAWINLTIDSHRCHDIPVSSTSLNHLIHWKAAPGKVKRSVEWSEHWQWIVLQFLSARQMTGKLRRKQPLMKW